MPVARTRPSSLSIQIPSTFSWQAPRLPTPKKPTCPQLSKTSESLSNFISPSAPPIPQLSYWLPDTPSPSVSPISSRNPFLSTPPTLSLDPRVIQALFPMASPLLPASPLSIFDHASSPTSPIDSPTCLSTFQQSRTPTLTRTTFLSSVSSNLSLSSRFLFPRTPPCPPQINRNAYVYDAAKIMATRNGSIGSLAREREKMKAEFYQFLAIKNMAGSETEAVMARKQKERSIVKWWKIQAPWKKR